MGLTDIPQQPASVEQIDVFREKSVAASNWQLIIFTKEGGQTRLKIDELDDIELFFFHLAKDRP